MEKGTVSVLIADGRAHARSAMRLLLAHEPDIVVAGEAADLDETAALMASYRPDVVLLDWELVERNGESAMDGLRAASPESVLIALSGQPQARHEALAAGADAFVSKGDPPERLLAAVQECRRERLRGPRGEAGRSSPAST